MGTGRIEHQLQIEKSIKEKLRNEPDFISDYYEYLVASGAEGTTCSTYIRYVTACIHGIEKKKGKKIRNIKEITAGDVTHYMSHLRFLYTNGKVKQASHSYRATVWTALNSFFSYCVKSNLLEQNYMELIARDSASKDDVERIALSPEELNRVISNVQEEIREKKRKGLSSIWKQRDLCIILLFIYTGMRVTALTEIDIEDVNFEEQEVTIIDKNFKTHVYPLNKEIIENLKAWLLMRKTQVGDQEPALFISTRKKRISVQMVRKMTDQYTEILGYDKKITPHKFRGSYVTNIYNATKDIFFAQKCVGHSKVATTELYVKDTGEERAEGLNLMEQLISTK